MKFMIQFKDPDAVYDAIQDAVRVSLAERAGLSGDELEALEDVRAAKCRAFIGPWVEYGEYVRIEFDMEAGTATVLRVKP